MVALKEVTNMFWALTLESGKRYTQKVEKAFHLSMAALEETNKKQGEGMVSVMISTEKAEFLICSLRHKTHFNQTLDLNFTEGEEITFFVNGDGTVHLSGYQLEDERDDFDIDDLEEDESEDEAPELVPSKGTKRKSQPTESNAKKIKVATKKPDVDEDDDNEEDEDDEDDDDDDDDLVVESFLDDEVDDDESEMEEDEDDDEEEEEEEEVKPQKKNPLKQNIQAQTPKSEKKKQEKKAEQATPAQEKKPPQTPSSSVTETGDASESTKKKRKRKKKKNKDGETPDKPQQEKQQEKQANQSKTPHKQVLQGGLVMEEHRTGNGPVAQKGKMVHVYYVGKLQKDGKQFDSCTSGKPFKFRLGTKEVISGWDRGLEGMKVGGKRRLIVPPKEGYGNQRQGPIPPNSTLIFDIELKSVS